MAGGLTYALADLFLYLSKSLEYQNPDPAWIYLFGAVLCGFGFLSLYNMVKENLSKRFCYFTLIGIIGLAGALYTHFVFGCLSPLLYKALNLQGISDATYLSVHDIIYKYNRPLVVFLYLCTYTQLVVIIFGLCSGRFHLKNRVLIYMIGLTIVVNLGLVLFFALFKIRGALGCVESIFEASFYFVPYLYWTKVLNNKE